MVTDSFIYDDLILISAQHKLVCPMGPGYGPDGLGEYRLIAGFYCVIVILRIILMNRCDANFNNR